MKNQIRVLHLVTAMDRGGLENRLMDIFREIEKKYVFDFYTLRNTKGFFDDEIKSIGGKVFYSNPITLRNIKKAQNSFRQFLISHKEYDIIHVHLNQWSGYFLSEAKKLGVNYRIAHSRTALKGLSVKNIIKNFLKKNVVKHSNINLAVSLKAGKWLFNNKHFRVIQNAVTMENYIYSEKSRQEIREKLKINNDKVYIHVGNIKREKNHKFLLKVFKEIVHYDNKSKLVLVGDDFLEGEIHNYVKKAGIDKHVIFIEKIQYVGPYLSAADVFLFPSVYEGFPGAVLEAVTNGLPCIVSDKISYEIKTFKNVHTLDIGIRSIQKWVDLSRDLHRNNITIIEGHTEILFYGYDIKNTTKLYENLYSECHESVKSEDI